jgi:hypothetical protein
VACLFRILSLKLCVYTSSPIPATSVATLSSLICSPGWYLVRSKNDEANRAYFTYRTQIEYLRWSCQPVQDAALLSNMCHNVSWWNFAVVSDNMYKFLSYKPTPSKLQHSLQSSPCSTAVHKSRMPGRLATKLCTLAPNMCVCSVWNFCISPFWCLNF